MRSINPCRAAALAGIILLGSAPLLAHAATPFDDAIMAAMKRMDVAMTAAPMTGDADRDFIAMMLPHHQAAVEMATSEVAHGHDPRLLRLAQEIVVTQGSEIQVMQLVARDLAATPRK